jgi:hypothetical protein
MRYARIAIAAILTALVSLGSQAALAERSSGMVSSFTTATNAGFTGGILDLYPFVGGDASRLVPVPDAGSVMIAQSTINAGQWNIVSGSQSFSIPCGSGSASPIPASSLSLSPSVDQLIAGFEQRFAGNGPNKILVETKKIAGVIYDRNSADGFLTTITTSLDAQGKDTQVTQLITFFRPALQDPIFPCLIARQAFGLSTTLPNDYAFQQVIGEMLNLEAATVHPPANFVMSGDKLPVGEFLLFAQVMLFGIDTSPGSGNAPNAVYTIENGNIM